MAKATYRDRLKIKLKTHLDYVKARQRSAEYETRPTQRKRAALQMIGKDIYRMSPLALGAHLVGCGLLQDLAGQPCARLAAGQCRPKGYGIRSILGRMCTPTNPKSADIYKETLHYRCQCCRVFVPVDYQNPLFELKGGGAHKPDGPGHVLFQCS